MAKKLFRVFVLIFALICVFVSCDNNANTPNTSQNPTHTHSYGEWETIKPATCTADGIKERDCSCGDIQKTDIPATGHTFGAWTTTKEVTCTVNGAKERACACGETETSVISAAGHKFSAWTTIADATCTVDGSKERTCACGETETSVISAAGHKFSAWTTIADATCTVDGSKERTCSCGEKETEIIKASHSWEDATCVAAKECSKCHMTEGSALGHTAQFGTCDRCGNEITATMVCTNSLPQSFTSKYSTGRNGSTTKITNVSVDTSRNIMKISVACQVLATYNSDDAYIAYYIKDPNGNIVESWRIYKLGCIEGLVFTSTITFTPTMAGEYTITFYDFSY